MKRLIIISAIAFSCLSGALAQTETKKDVLLFKHLDFAVTGGTTGIGFDIATPIVKNVQVRAGMSFMPSFTHNMTFGLETYGYSSAEGSDFGKMAELMYNLTGCKVDNKVEVEGKPKYHNFKLLVDVFPFKNKKWHLTAGFYYGNSTLAEAVNKTEEMPSLVGVKMYNHMYDFIMNEEYWDTPIYNDIYLSPDVAEQLAEKFTATGRVGVNLGTRVDDGTPYMLEPDENGMVSAKASVNRFKPYIGFGYGHAIGSKNRTFNVSFDCGMMFWGGTPNIVTHDGTSLVNDVRDVKGKVGDYVSLVKAFKVFPVIDLRVTYRIF